MNGIGSNSNSICRTGRTPLVHDALLRRDNDRLGHSRA